MTTNKPFTAKRYEKALREKNKVHQFWEWFNDNSIPSDKQELIVAVLDDMKNSWYEQGKSDALKNPDRFEQFTLKQYWFKHGQIEAYEEVLKKICEKTMWCGFNNGQLLKGFLEQRINGLEGE
jgi:hypothetical protein